MTQGFVADNALKTGGRVDTYYGRGPLKWTPTRTELEEAVA